MKHAKQRVIALDYFRGICIIIILLSHSAVFSMPFAYLSGMGKLWSSAAEMFFLLSGITLGIVRQSRVKRDFRNLVRKCWTRAAYLYGIYIITVVFSMSLGMFFTSRDLTNYNVWSSPTTSGIHLLAQIMTFSYTSGFAAFLMYFSVFMLLAPFMLYLLRTRAWPILLLTSGFLYMVGINYPYLASPLGIYAAFATWQLYFVIGLTLARYRLEIISWAHSLPLRIRSWLTYIILSVTGFTLAVSSLVGFNLYPTINYLTIHRLVPHKFRIAYLDLSSQKPLLDNLFMSARSGLLRPFIALLWLAAAYLLYQKYKKPILNKTGKFVNTMGQNTLWIFVAQAIAIPILAALPIQRNLFSNVVLTSMLFGMMWAVAKRNRLTLLFSNYLSDLKDIYSNAKYKYGTDDA